MPRPEIELEGDGARVELARELRRLRVAAGEPSYRTLAQRTPFVLATLAKATSGRHPCPGWEVVEALGRELGGDLDRLRELWRQARRDEGLPVDSPSVGQLSVATRDPGGGATTRGASTVGTGRLRFKNPVANPDEPQGRVATRLRELVQASDIQSAADLKERVHYTSSSLSEAMSGRRRQSHGLIRRFVEACIPDREDAEAEVARLFAILDERPSTNEPPVEELLLDRDERGDHGRLGDSPIEDVTITDDGIDPFAMPLPSPPSPVRPAADVDLPQRPRRRRLVRWFAVTVVVLLVLAGVSYGVYAGLHPMCGPDVPRIDGQCIGVTDGSVNVASDPGFTDVLGKIAAENDRVMRAAPGAPVVSVAYTASFPASQIGFSRDLQLERKVRELEGAFMVQLQRNEAGGPNVLGGAPRVRLLVANLGDDGNQWQNTVDRLQTLTSAQDPDTGRLNLAPLVAVLGLDRSSAGTAEAVAALDRDRIPIVSTGSTGSTGALGGDLTQGGFFSVAPSASDQAAAAARYASTLGGPAARPLVVEDDAGGDLYGSVAALQFQRQLALVSQGAPPLTPLRFDSGRPGVQTAFALALPAICETRPDAVFFAGRGTNLPDFIRALAARPCPDLPITVVTLSDGRVLSDALHAEATNPAVEPQLKPAVSTGVRVVVAARAHPGQWSDATLILPSSHAVLDGSFATAYPQQFRAGPDQPPAQVDDGGDVIMGHDAMQVIVEAINRSRPPQSGDPVTAARVGQALSGITAGNPVYTASGPVYFRAAGDPVDKNVPITQIAPDGTILLVATAPR